MLLVVLLLGALASCNADDGANAGTAGGFRNLGKRGDSNLGGDGASASLR